MKQLEKRDVDICMCVKDRGKIIRQSIENLSSQTFQEFNIIVCDGKSADTTPNQLIGMAENDERLLICQVPSGSYVDAHNKALSETVSEYICWIDSDDVMTPNRIEKEKKFLDEHPSIDIVTCGTMFSIDGKAVAMPNSIVDLGHEEIEDFVMKKGYSLSDICHFQSMMVRKSSLSKLAEKNLFFKEYEDGRAGEGFMLALFYSGLKFANIGDVMYCHVLDFAGMTSANYEKRIFADEINEKTPGRSKQAIMKLLKENNR